METGDPSIGGNELGFAKRKHDQARRSALDIITISRRLGHSKASITLDVYGHLFTENDTAAADAIDAIF